uniref:ATPase-f n=1 Tax=Hemiscolopendra marginata TaxID=943146 RepID=A0A646QEM3_9MYRI
MASKLLGDIGQYPKEYNEKIHGPYDPARYYGKADTPLAEVKLSEVPSWFLRRNKSPRAFMGVCSRAFWSWQQKYVQPKRTGIAPVIHVCVGSMVFFYLINYGKIRKHRNYKYHW